jgi:8-oxo-dGTP pyrophosphatase MutT (NUDIX family)
MSFVSADSVPALPAATVLLLRDSDSGVQVLMVERPQRGFFGGLMVFPGGAVDEADSSEVARGVVPGEYDDFPYRVAALRELAEETGIALTSLGPRLLAASQVEQVLESMRREGRHFDPSALSLVSRWVTPEVAPKRFDTWFYVAEVSDPPAVRLAETELVSYSWVTASAALSALEAGEWRMFTPTISHLSWLAKRQSASDAVAAAQGADGRSLVIPRILEDGSIVPVHIPSDR